MRTRNRYVVALGLAPALVGVVAAFETILTGGPEPGGAVPMARFLLALVMLSGILTTALFVGNPVPLRKQVRVVADGSGLTLAGGNLAAAAIRSAVLVPAHDGSTLVRIEQAWRPRIDIHVGDANVGRRLLHALGFDASQRVAPFRGTSRIFANWWLGTLGLSALVGVALAAARFLPGNWAQNVSYVVPFALLLAAFSLIPSRIDVGADGVVVTWLGRRRFIACGEISYVEGYVDGFGNSRISGVRLTLQSGEIYSIPITQQRWQNDRTSAVVQRIREAMEAHRGGAYDDGAVVVGLGRNDMSLAAWIRELRAIGAGANATLRTAPVDPSRLWALLESPRAPIEERAAAAVALSAVQDDDANARLRVAAESIADPRLRVAIEAVAGADDEALEAALAEIAPARASSSPSSSSS